jgi:hypothetical protein
MTKHYIVIAIDYSRIFLDKPSIQLIESKNASEALYEAQCDKDTGVHDRHEAKNYSWFAFNLENLKNE